MQDYSSLARISPIPSALTGRLEWRRQARQHPAHQAVDAGRQTDALKNDAVAWPENNLDIAIQRYNLNIADTDVLRAQAGGSTLGVNSGIVAGTPGGGTGGLSGSVGSGTGGTSAGSGGAGTGTGGLVNSTLGSGPAITARSRFSGTLQMDRAFTRSTNIFQPHLCG
jgi:hypothetical protein